MTDKQDWPQEPWYIWEDNVEEVPYITDANFKPVTFPCDGLDDATRERIVACVSACAGVPTDALEAWGTTINIIRLHHAEDVEGYIVKLHCCGPTDITPHLKTKEALDD